MDGADKHRKIRLVRIAAGVAILLSLLAFTIVLFPPYAANMRFQQYIETVARDPANARKELELIRVDIVRHAAAMGVPVRLDQVRLARAESGVKVEVRYVVRVDFPLYTVDLHFRPQAGGRL